MVLIVDIIKPALEEVIVIIRKQWQMTDMHGLLYLHEHYSLFIVIHLFHKYLECWVLEIKW